MIWSLRIFEGSESPEAVTFSYFCPRGNPAVFPTAGLCGNPTLHSHTAQPLPNTIRSREGKGAHAPSEAKGTWYKVLLYPLPFMSPAHAVQLCHNDPMALQRLHSGPYPLFSFMLSPPSSNTFLHKVRVPSFSSLPIHLLIFQRPSYVLLQLLTLHPFALSWQHTLRTRSISHPHLLLSPKEESETGCKQRLE